MVKSRAEIQREYRQRKKERDSTYLAKERERTKKYYVPIDERSASSKRTRREKVRKNVKHFRERRRLLNENVDVPETIHSNENGISTDRGILTIKLPAFDTSKNRTRKRIARAVARNHKEMNKLKTENENLKRRMKTISKRYERLVNKTATPNNMSPNAVPETQNKMNMTPRKRVATEIAEAGITPSKIPKRMKQTLLFANVMSDEVKIAREDNGQKGRSVISRVLSGKLIKKYRLNSKLNKMTGIKRGKVATNKRCDKPVTIRKRVNKRNALKEQVSDFLLRDDNSRVMPGKNDKVKDGSVVKQKRVLNDSMSFLHLKFKSETECNVSFATFCRLRPKSISLTRFITKNQCLCQKHQNMALTLKSMKTCGVSVCVNPDEFMRQLENKSLEEFTNNLPDVVNHQQWKKITQNDGKKRTKIVGKEVPKSDFCQLLKSQTDEFKGHIYRIKTQYKAMASLKEILNDTQAIVQMDFAENFACSSADEVQSAYWNSNAVTLHPVVVYFKDNGETKHVNYVFVSDDLGHNIGHVFAILKKLIPDVKNEMNGRLQKVFYLTDSPSSQYRNKTSFFIVSEHQELLGTAAEWNFWETGHGKGACDGIGGTAKRMAELSIRQGKVNIQDGTDFYKWGSEYHKSSKYIFVTEDDCSNARSELDVINGSLLPVKGTMKVHQVFSTSKGTVNTRDVSCYCGDCMDGRRHDFVEHTVVKPNKQRDTVMTTHETAVDVHTEILTNIVEVDVHAQATTNDTELEEHTGVTTNNKESDKEEMKKHSTINDEIMEVDTYSQAITSETDTGNQNVIEPTVHDWIVAMYDGTWHVGQVKQVDASENDCFVSFMRQTNARGETKVFNWPSPPDNIWINFDSILMHVQEPTPISRSGRSYKILDNEMMKLEVMFGNK